MRIAYWTEEGQSIAWARRLLDEGADVLLYHAKKAVSKVGEGLVPITPSRERWLQWGAQDPATIYFFDCTNNGAVADALRASGKRVVGGGSFMDLLEMDRAFGETFAQSHGLLVPPTKRFTSVRAAVEFMRSHPDQELGDGGWAWKPDKDIGCNYTRVDDADKVIDFLERTVIPKKGDRISCIVQERIPGIALSTARWWNGMRWTGPYEGTLEEKKLMDGDLGPSTGCALGTVWFYLEEQPKIAQALQFDALADGFRKHRAPPGIYDINAVVTKTGAYFLEWTPRLGIDAELCSQQAVSSLSRLLETLATGGEVDDLFNVQTAYHGVRVTVPPYPCESDELLGTDSSATGTPVEGLRSLHHDDFVMTGLRYGKAGLEVANPWGYVGMAAARDTSLEAGYASIAKTVERLDISDKQARTDGAKIIRKDVEKMRSLGWRTTPYLDVKEADHAAAS